MTTARIELVMLLRVEETENIYSLGAAFPGGFFFEEKKNMFIWVV